MKIKTTLFIFYIFGSLIFCFCSQKEGNESKELSKNQLLIDEKDNKIEKNSKTKNTTSSNIDKKEHNVKASLETENLLPPNFDSLKVFFKYQNLTKFDLTSTDYQQIKKIDSIQFKRLQLDKVFGNVLNREIKTSHSYCDHCLYYYSFQGETKNYFSIVILGNGFEYASVLYWINYTKKGELIAKTDIALYRQEGGSEDVQKSVLISNNKISKKLTQVGGNKLITYHREEISQISESGSIKDSITYKTKPPY